jgi:hypothetical protein
MPNPVSGVTRRDSSSYPNSDLPGSSSKGSTPLFAHYDPASDMLALPKTYPRLKRWMVVAIVIGGAAALLMLTMLSL